MFEGIAIALAFLLAGSYYDLFNKRVIPDWLSYSFLGVAILYTVFIGGIDTFKIGAATAILLLGYLIYRMGYVGGADVIFLSAIMLLLPLETGTMPSIIIVLLTSTIAMAIYLEAQFFASRTEFKPRIEEIATCIVWIVGYAAVSYFLYNMGFQSFAFMALAVGFVSAIFALIKKDITKSMVTWVTPKQIIEEDILAVDEMDKKLVEKLGLERLLTQKQIAKIVKAKLKKVPVYGKLPPYIPFILVGVAAAAILALI